MMAYLLLAEKQHQILLKNVERVPPKEVHAVEIPKRKPKDARPGKFRKGNQKRHKDKFTKSETSEPSSSRFRGSGSFRKSNIGPPQQEQRNCYKCGRKDHIAKDCRAPDYVASMYKELRLLKSQKRKTHMFDASSLDDTNKELENYLVSISRFPAVDPVIALLDSATTHTILRSPEYFKFEGHRATRHTSDIVTIAGRRNFCYRKGQARVLLPGGTPILCERAMYSPNAPRSLVSYRDLRANGIHITTAQVNGEEVLSVLAMRRQEPMPCMK